MAEEFKMPPYAMTIPGVITGRPLDGLILLDAVDMKVVGAGAPGLSSFAESVLSQIANALGVSFVDLTENYPRPIYSSARLHLIEMKRWEEIRQNRSFALRTAPPPTKARLSWLLGSDDPRQRRRGMRLLDRQVIRNKMPSAIMMHRGSVTIYPVSSLKSRPFRGRIIGDEADGWGGPGKGFFDTQLATPYRPTAKEDTDGNS